MQMKQIVPLVAVVLVIAGVVVAKSMKQAPPQTVDVAEEGAEAPEVAGSSESPEPLAARETSRTAGLPRLLDLGSVGCTACQEMEPILEELEAELKGQVAVEFIDVLKEEGVADEYSVKVIPTQIFFSADGEELFRNVGVFPKDEILAKMRELDMIAD